MNRRGFLAAMGIGIAAAATIKLKLPAFRPGIDACEMRYRYHVTLLCNAPGYNAVIYLE